MSDFAAYKNSRRLLFGLIRGSRYIGVHSPIRSKSPSVIYDLFAIKIKSYSALYSSAVRHNY